MKNLISILLCLLIVSNAESQTFRDYFDSGWTKDSLQDYSGAVEEYNKALELNPSCPACFMARAISEEHMEDYRSAIADYTELIDEFNNNHQNDFLIKSRAKNYLVLQEYTDAINDIDRYLELFPKDAEAYSIRGVANNDMGDYLSAMKDYNKAILLNPKFDNCFLLRGLTKYNLKDYRGAIADYSKAIAIKPRNEDAYFKRGRAKYNLSDYNGAILDFNKVIEINPNNAMAYALRGGAKLVLNQKESACLDMSKSGELGNENAYNAIKEYCQ